MTEQQAQPATSKYVDALITIHNSRPDKGFAFGTARINGVSTEVYVGSRCHAIQDGNGRWEKKEPKTPIEDDLLKAKICTEVDPGKKPFAAFWKVLTNFATGSDGFDQGVIDDVWQDVDETPCEWCDCWPCRCEPEY